MKKIFVLFCIVLGLYGLSWGNLGESVEGQKANPNVTHTSKLDSAKFIFYYPYGNGYKTVYGYPDDDDSLTAVDTTVAGMDLDSIGLHTVKIAYYPHGGGSTTFSGSWLHRDPTPGDTIQRNASTFNSSSDKVTLADTSAGDISYTANNQNDYKATGFSTHGASDVAALWGDTLTQLLVTIDSVITSTGFDPDTTLLTFLRYIRNNQADYKATGFATHSAADVKALWGDTLSQLLVTIDSVITATGFDPDSTLLVFLRYIRNNQADYKATGFSTFDPTTDTVIWVDTVLYAGAAQKNTEAEITGWVKATLEDTSNVARDATKDDYKDGVAGGTGSNQVTIRVKSSTDSASIPGASIAVWNSDQTALMGLLSSDNDSGKAIFALDNGTYNLRIQKYKFQWTVPITIGVSGNKDTTIYATEFTPSPPPTPYFVTVYGYLDSIGLIGQRAKISCTIHAQELRYGSVLLGYYSYTKTVYTNASGYWEMFLYANEDLTPAGTMYEFIIETPYQPVVKKWVTVPKSGPWEFTW